MCYMVLARVYECRLSGPRIFIKFVERKERLNQNMQFRGENLFRHSHFQILLSLYIIRFLPSK